MDRDKNVINEHFLTSNEFHYIFHKYYPLFFYNNNPKILFKCREYLRENLNLLDFTKDKFTNENIIKAFPLFLPYLSLFNVADIMKKRLYYIKETVRIEHNFYKTLQVHRNIKTRPEFDVFTSLIKINFNWKMFTCKSFMYGLSFYQFLYYSLYKDKLTTNDYFYLFISSTIFTFPFYLYLNNWLEKKYFNYNSELAGRKVTLMMILNFKENFVKNALYFYFLRYCIHREKLKKEALDEDNLRLFYQTIESNKTFKRMRALYKDMSADKRIIYDNPVIYSSFLSAILYTPIDIVTNYFRHSDRGWTELKNSNPFSELKNEEKGIFKFNCRITLFINFAKFLFIYSMISLVAFELKHDNVF
jgi:hypothetical protein